MIEPKEIFEVLNQDVIGQDPALREMSVALYKHLIGHSVGNVLMIGNSGTGKTTIMRAVEEFFDRTEGYEEFSTIIRINANLVADLAARGTQTNVVMERLARQAASNLGEERADLDAVRRLTAQGIVCVDEVDKIRSMVGGEPNVKGIVAQDSLLTLMENEDVQVATPYFADGEWRREVVPINTSHVLFVAGGAFEDLYNQVYDRVTEGSGLTHLWRLVPLADGTLERRVVFRMGDHLTHEDLFRYGMTPQFLARFDSIIMLGDLTAPHLIRIFMEIPGAIFPIARDFFHHEGIRLVITDEATLFLADRAAQNHRLGARALREVFGKVIRTFEFDPRATGRISQVDGHDVLELTREVVEECLKPPD